MEDKNSHLLLTPAAKKSSTFKREYPFPIVTNECQENETDAEWTIIEGHLQENCVLVHDDESVKMLYNMGYFGKGTLSKNAPKICLKKKSAAPRKKQKISEQETTLRDSNEDSIIDVVDSDDENVNLEEEKGNESEVLLSSNSDDCERTSCSKQPEDDAMESLQLTFQEAYFLSYGLGCLIVKDNDKPLNLQVLWTKFCELSRGSFPYMYTAYHHFRSRGWIVKSGLKFGADYVLYKDGPPFYHATYSVIVQPVKDNLRSQKGGRELTWSSLSALNRVNSTAGKGLLFLYVIKPSTITDSRYMDTPFCISQFKLEEVLFKRWVAAENREDDIP